MKTIGIIGGMSAVSTRLYHAELDRLARERFGGLHGADLIIRSLDFAPIAEMQSRDAWDELGAQLADEAQRLEAAGAEVLLLATNTMHKVADAIKTATQLPFVHIADATAARIRAAGLTRPALIGTAFTMEQAFYTDRLEAAGLRPIIPNDLDRRTIHTAIYERLCKAVITDADRTAYEAIASRLVDAGADGLILGCTEVGLLLGPSNVSVPVFDTTLIHADAAFSAAVADDGGHQDVRQGTGTHG